MNSVPPTFMHAVSRFVRNENLDEITGRFGEISASSLKDNFGVHFEIVYQNAADSVEYRILREQNANPYDCVPYTFAPGDYRFVRSFVLYIYSKKPETDHELMWTAAKLTDRTFRSLLRASFPYVALKIREDDEYDCSKIVELLPDYFNQIEVNCKYSEALDRIIHKSNEEKRLNFMDCHQFYHERTVMYVLQFVISNHMLYDCSWEKDCVTNTFAIIIVFELWIDQPEVFECDFAFKIEKTDALTHLSRFSFERTSDCNCSRLEGYNYGKPLETDCAHFKCDHRTASGRQALLTVFLKDPGFENMTSINQAMDYDPVSFFIEFCC